MALLSEFSISPCIFDIQSYSSEETGSLCLQYLKEAVLSDSIVRNLFSGQWIQYVLQNNSKWHLKGKELIKKIRIQGRLRNFESISSELPQQDLDWCKEALASNEIEALSGIITNKDIKESSFKEDKLIAAINKLSSAVWWQQRSPSVRLRRCTKEYVANLKLILQASNSVMFIDPYLDPGQHHYKSFKNLLKILGERKLKPLVEIHRVCCPGSGERRREIDPSEWVKIFNREYGHLAKDLNLKIEVFLWDSFHDRYMISNLIGISVPHGFDTTTDQNATTTWTRLSREDRDDIQREFEENSVRHNLKAKFTIT